MILVPLLLTLWIVMALVIRYVMAREFVYSWMAVCAAYIAARRAPDELIQDDFDEMEKISACWSIYQIVSHIWIWDFSRFVIDAESRDKVLDFFTHPAKMTGDEKSP